MNKFLKLFGLLAVVTLFAFMPNNDKIKIVIDASHGGTDYGGTYSHHTEKDIVAAIVTNIKNLNTGDNIEFFFTRENDNTLTLAERTKIINKINPDLVISVHVNNNKNPDSNGIECFVAKDDISNSAKSKVYAEKLLTEFTEKMNLKSRGIQQAPFFILKNTQAPAIVLELGFLSNENDRKYLTNKESQIQIAKTILNFASKIEK
jgi:N-acetylmuramoyl-L-alanine amidase